MLLCCCYAVSQSGNVLDCPALPKNPVPTNVNNLHPNDVKVVMALGDSITAGFGIMGYPGLANEYRGLSGSIGGDPGAITTPNFFKTYTPDLIGASIGYHIVEYCAGIICLPGQYQPAKDVFNAAQSGATFFDLPGHELDYLIKTLKAHPEVNMEKDWKLMTIFVGANDLCSACGDKAPFTDPTTYSNRMLATLERIRKEIPRTFVNLVPMFNLSGVYDLGLNTTHCTNTHKDLAFECACIFSPNATAARLLVDTLVMLYNEKIDLLAQQYQNKYPEFAVVVQPFAKNTVVKHLPVTFLSGLDCFHPSLSAHQAMAIGLWNNMLTPRANKKLVLDIAEKPLCPTAQTLLFTN